MPDLTALQASINTVLQIDTAYPLSEGIGRDRIFTGSSLPPLAQVLMFGTGYGKANLDYYERLTLATGNNDFDLTAMETTRPPNGQRIFTRIKYLLVRIAVPATGVHVLLGNQGADSWQGPITTSDGAITIATKLEVLDLDGFSIDSTHRYLRLTNPGLSLLADMILLGEGTTDDGSGDGSGLSIGGGVLAIS